MNAGRNDEVSAELRREMIRRARDKRLRIVEDFEAAEPNVWNPTQVLNPECQIPFTDISAWHFIADQIEAGCVISVVSLKKPPGEIGYVLSCDGAQGQPRIYVKFSLRGNRIKGRSFHNSTRAGE